MTARKRQYQDLYVYMNGIQVGTFARESTGQLIFAYDHNWLEMAKRCQFSEEKMQAIMDEVCDSMENVIAEVTSSLPSHFPEQVYKSIFAGMRRSKDRCAS